MCLFVAKFFTPQVRGELFFGYACGLTLADPFLFTRLQVKGMFLHFFNYVFLLDLSLETPQRIFDGFTILNPNLGQSIHLHSGCDRFLIITYFRDYGDLSLVFR